MNRKKLLENYKASHEFLFECCRIMKEYYKNESDDIRMLVIKWYVEQANSISELLSDVMCKLDEVVKHEN